MIYYCVGLLVITLTYYVYKKTKLNNQIIQYEMVSDEENPLYNVVYINFEEYCLDFP